MGKSSEVTYDPQAFRASARIQGCAIESGQVSDLKTVDTEKILNHASEMFLK